MDNIGWFRKGDALYYGMQHDISQAFISFLNCVIHLAAMAIGNDSIPYRTRHARCNPPVS